MALLTREEFYKLLGQALRNAREERGLSREQLAEELNDMPIDPERHLRHIAVLGILGLDLGDKSSCYCVLDAAGGVLLERKVSTTAKAMRDVFGFMPRCRIALEAGTHSSFG